MAFIGEKVRKNPPLGRVLVIVRSSGPSIRKQPAGRQVIIGVAVLDDAVVHTQAA
jgi:hypothetical protein